MSMLKRRGGKSSRNSTRTSTNQTGKIDPSRGHNVISRKERSAFAFALLQFLRKCLVSFAIVAINSMTAIGGLRPLLSTLSTDFDSALFLTLLSLLLFRRVDVIRVCLPDEPLEHHLFQERSRPVRILTEFFSIHEFADLLIVKADALRLLHD